MFLKVTLNFKKILYFLIIFLLFTFLSLPATTLAAGPMGVQFGAPIDGTTKQLYLTDAVADQLAKSGAGWVRLNFIVSPYGSDNSEFYSVYDGIVNRLRSRGLQIVGLMSNESWPGSQQDWVANNNEKRGGDGYNTYIDKYGYAFARMAKHWEGKIKYWEIWNEPNAYSQDPNQNPDSPGGSFIYPSNFAAMLTHAHSQVHYYNKIDVQIISGGIFGHDISGFAPGPAGADYLSDTYNMGINQTGKFAWAKATYGTYPLDAIGQHIYINQWPSNSVLDTTAFLNYINYYQDVIKKWEGVFSNKKIWITEFGWATNNMSESQQASNLEKAFKIIKGKGVVDSALWFKLEEDPKAGLYFGLYRADGTQKPSYSKFKTANTYEGKKSNGTTVTKISSYFKNKGGLKAFGSPYDNGGSVYAHTWDFGYVQDFKGGEFGPLAIFDTGYRVQLGFWSEYLQNNNHNKLRFPTSDEFSSGLGVRQNFQGGYMTWNPITGVNVTVY
ncbi:hypothetical protein HYS91_01935 [Candidatus Daviesbacteria bacterium]|nr:hypothetical protein [Candidatus Daviesbacteria bacterium]